MEFKFLHRLFNRSESRKPAPPSAVSIMPASGRSDKEWRNRRGELHREDGPAVETARGDKEWFRNGRRHREDGPACEFADGGTEWWRHGKRHRIDGPAREYANGYRAWFRNGLELTDDEVSAIQGHSTTGKMNLDNGNPLKR